RFSRDWSSDVCSSDLLPSRAAWLARVREWGLSPRDDIVVYDDAGGAVAARMWWMMRWIGHESVAVLDGGWQAWVAAGYPVTTAVDRKSVGEGKGGERG